MKSIIGIQCSSEFSSLTLYRKTCPLGLLTVLSSSGMTNKAIVYNEDISGDVFENGSNLLHKANIVLLSAHSGNIQRSLIVAGKLAEAGKQVYIGGPEPSMIGPRLLLHHPQLYGMIVGPGENLLNQILNVNDGEHPRIFRQKSFQDISPLKYKPLFAQIDFSNAQVSYNLLWDFDKHEGLSYFWGNDCSQSRKRCYFCGRLSMGIGYRKSTIIWKELLWAYRHGIRFFYNTTDSVTTDIMRFQEFCSQKPPEMVEDIHRVFVNAKDVNSHLLTSLQRINGIAVIGVESFGNFEATGKKNTTISENLKAIRKLYDSKIKMVISFVFGLPGETPESIEANEQGISNIVESFGEYIDSIHISPLLITMGSPAFRDIMSSPGMKKKYDSMRVPYNVIEMSRDYFQKRCNVTREYCIERIFRLSEHIKKLAPNINIGAKGVMNSELPTTNNAFMENEISHKICSNPSIAPS